jgi:hypothetical protein
VPLQQLFGKTNEIGGNFSKDSLSLENALITTRQQVQ